MADIGASVLARLRNKAKETGRSNQLFAQHRINCRISLILTAEVK